MKNEPEIIKELRREEKVGKLSSIFQTYHKELEISEEISKKTSNENIKDIKQDVKIYDFGLKSAQQRDSSDSESTDLKEIFYHTFTSGWRNGHYTVEN